MEMNLKNYAVRYISNDFQPRIALYWKSREVKLKLGMPMNAEIHIRLYEELNDFLPSGKRKRRFNYRLKTGADVATLLAELGVPRDQVELVLVNGDSTGFSHLLKSGDFVAVYPVFESLDVSSLIRVRPKPLRLMRFVAGPRLIRLTRYLRLLGFDTLDGSTWSLDKIILITGNERRILLTRDPALMERPSLTRKYLVRETAPKRQLIEVLRRFDLASIHAVSDRSGTAGKTGL